MLNFLTASVFVFFPGKLTKKTIGNNTKSKVALFVRFYIVTVLKYQVKRRLQDVRYI